MKLLAKTSLYYLIFAVPVLVLAGFISFYFLTSEMKENTDELLERKKAEVIEYLSDEDGDVVNMLDHSGEVNIHFVSAKYFSKHILTDTILYEKDADELAPYRMLNTNIKAIDGYYSLQVFRSTLEFDDLMYGILSALLVMFAFLLLAFLSLNYFISKSLWKSFYTSLDKLKNFRLDQVSPEKFESSSILEFKELNEVLSVMMNKMLSDYRNQKQFTENASHEIQTPLAVIQAKVDLLIQSEKLGEYEMNLIKSIDDSVSKLSRLNKSLLLLSKIENRQFTLVKLISIKKIIDDALWFFNEAIQEKKITVKLNIRQEMSLFINADLCEILVNNLLINAIRHNINNGVLGIEMEHGSLTIYNSSESNKPLAKNIFNRFQKNSASSTSIGLGLAIANEIAKANNLNLSYRFGPGIHYFSLTVL